MPKRETVTVTTNGSGAGTGYTGVVSGKISQIRYVKTDFADGSTITITNELTGETIWTEVAVNASATRAPRQATHTTAGVAALYAGSGQAVLDKIAISKSRIQVTVTNGGDTKTGTFYITLE